jgi:hypothetical protein
MAYFEEIFQLSPGGNEEDHENSISVVGPPVVIPTQESSLF